MALASEDYHPVVATEGLQEQGPKGATLESQGGLVVAGRVLSTPADTF